MKLFQPGKTGNRLLNLLPAGEFDRLQPHLQKVELAHGQVLYEARSTIEHIYFPLSCVLSAVAVMRDGDAIEVATMGNEGMSGLPALGVVATSPNRVFAQIAGYALRADAVVFNPAGYSFTSLAMFDAIKTFAGPVYEVHISNIHARDELHRHSKLSSVVKAVIAGLGPYGYIVAMQAALHALGKLPDSLPAPLCLGPR